MFAVVTAVTGHIGVHCDPVLRKGWSRYAFFRILLGQGRNVHMVKRSMAEYSGQESL